MNEKNIMVWGLKNIISTDSLEINYREHLTLVINFTDVNKILF